MDITILLDRPMVTGFPIKLNYSPLNTFAFHTMCITSVMSVHSPVCARKLIGRQDLTAANNLMPSDNCSLSRQRIGWASKLKKNSEEICTLIAAKVHA